MKLCVALCELFCAGLYGVAVDVRGPDGGVEAPTRLNDVADSLSNAYN